MSGEILTHRDTLAKLMPRWLSRGVAQGLGYALAIQLDALTDGLVAGIRRRWPGLDGSEDALGIIGQARKIRRGPAEPASTYAVRLRSWLDAHRTRGGPYALLAQVHAYWVGTFDVSLIYADGTRFDLATSGDVTRTPAVSPWAPGPWPRWWLIYDWPDAVVTDGLWGDPGVWGDGYVWGAQLTAAQVADLRLIPEEWNAAHTNGTLVLRSGSGDLWGWPGGAWGDPGVWGTTCVSLTVR